MIFLHVHNVKRLPAWAVMDKGGILCMQFQQSSINYHDCYNKSTRAGYVSYEDHARTIRPYHTDLTKYK